MAAAAMIAFSLFALAACGTPADDLPPITDAAPGEYHLGAGDKLRIIIFGEERLTGEFQVGASGDIALPLIGGVHAAGLSTPEVEKEIASALRKAKMFKDPNVTVEIINYRPVFVLGEVSKPGQYPYQPGMSVVTAVAVAGGFTYRAVDNVFSIVRTTDAATLEQRAVRQTPVQPGDVITIYERRL